MHIGSLLIRKRATWHCSGADIGFLKIWPPSGIYCPSSRVLVFGNVVNLCPTCDLVASGDDEMAGIVKSQTVPVRKFASVALCAFARSDALKETN